MTAALPSAVKNERMRGDHNHFARRHSLWIGRIISNLERKKALAEEFGNAAGSEENFLAMLDRATAPDYGFLYVVFGLRIRFFNSYKTEFRIEEDRFEV